MMDATATLNDVISFNGRIRPPVAAAALLIMTVTVAAAWMISTALATNPHIDTRGPVESGSLAVAQPDTILISVTDVPGQARVSTASADAAAVAFETRWHGVTAFALANAVPPVTQPSIAIDLALGGRWAGASAPAAASPLLLVPQFPVERANSVPLPQPNSEKRVTPQQAYNKSLPLLELGNRTAVYDIAARTVYLPNGDRLEAHSGLGDKLDDPRYVHVRMRGPTPPNVYALALREQSFHGVRAIRLNPVDDGKMFGRDGMLAHTYMLGPNGQSNGCVSFKDYPKFLEAFLRGEVDRLIVVPGLGNTSWRTARARRGHDDQYAFNNQ